MARKNKTKKSQPVRDRTLVAARRVSNPRPDSLRSVGPTLAVTVRRVAEPALRASVKLKTPRTKYVDVKPSISDRPPSGYAAPVAAKAKKPVITEKHRQQSKLNLSPTPEPDARKSSEKARENNVCKKRPDSKKAARSKGGGGGRKQFVPWC